MPFSYYVRSSVHEFVKNIDFEPCTTPGNSAVCENDTDGGVVLDALNRIMPLVSGDDTTIFDFSILIAIGAFWKILYIAGVAYKTSLSSKFHAS